MQIYPTTPEQIKLFYYSLLVVGTVGVSGYAEAYGRWLPFIVMVIWTVFFMWELYVRPNVFPEEELSEDQKLQAATYKFLSNTDHKTKALSERQNKLLKQQQDQIKGLVNRVKELEREN